MFKVNAKEGLKLSFRWIAIACAVAVCLALGWMFAAGAFNSDKAEADATGDLTVTDDDIYGLKVCEDDTFIDTSLRPVGDSKDQRQFSDATSTPFKTTSKQEMFDEYVAEVCQNPTKGDELAQAFLAKPVAGQNVGELNPWLAEFRDKWDSDWNQWLTKDTNGVIRVNTEYQIYAKKLVYLLVQFENMGVQQSVSEQNWSLPLQVGGMPRTAKASEQENLPYLALAYTTKAGIGKSCPAYVMGLNLLDKRVELVGCEVAKKIAPKPTKPMVPKKPKTPPSKTGKTPPPPGKTPPPPGKTPPPPGKTPPPPSKTPEPKDVRQIPNAPTGGGSNANKGPGEKTKPTRPPATKRQNPAPPTSSGVTQTKAPKVSTKPKPSKPAPPVEPSKQPVNHGIVDED